MHVLWLLVQKYYRRLYYEPLPAWLLKAKTKHSLVFLTCKGDGTCITAKPVFKMNLFIVSNQKQVRVNSQSDHLSRKPSRQIHFLWIAEFATYWTSTFFSVELWVFSTFCTQAYVCTWIHHVVWIWSQTD